MVPGEEAALPQFCARRLHPEREGRILIPMDSPVVIPAVPLRPPELERFRGNPFDEMIKFVVDVECDSIAVGGEMHADAEALLLQHGSQLMNLWGGNLHPWETSPRIEHTSLINIRPASGNRSMLVQDAELRREIETIVRHWILLQW